MSDMSKAMVHTAVSEFRKKGVTNRFPGGFWEDRGYNWFAGV
jgi:hypothetical protein